MTATRIGSTTRSRAGVSVPDTPVISRAIDFARQRTEAVSTVDYLVHSPFDE